MRTPYRGRLHADRLPREPPLLHQAAPADNETTMEHGEGHNRRSIRLKGYDYTRDGAYFVTICTQGRERTFGAVVGGEMRPNACGREVARCWAWLAEQYPYVCLDGRIVMPDHTHAIIVIRDDHRNPAGWDGSNVTMSNVAASDVTDSNEICRGGSRTALPRTAPTTGSVDSSFVPTQRKRESRSCWLAFDSHTGAQRPQQVCVAS